MVKNSLTFLWCFALLGLKAQDVEYAPNANQNAQYSVNAESAQKSMSECSFWRVQMEVAAGAASGGSSFAGVALVGDEFWVSRWNAADIYVFDTLGAYKSSFTVASLTGTRALTYDGQYVYAANNSTTLYKIDPAAKTVVKTITIPQAARHCAYDSAASSGAGGFWIGNWATNIDLVDTNGTVIRTITATSHGLTAVYGSAVDYVSPGGPFIWLFDQSTGTSNATIVQLNHTTGLKTGVVRDVANDNILEGSLAGGMFVTNKLKGGKVIIGGILQTNNILFGYSIDTTEYIDMKVRKVGLKSGYRMIPSAQLAEEDVMANFANESCIDTTISTKIMAQIRINTTLLYSDSININSVPLITNTIYDFSTPFLPEDLGDYNVVSYLNHNYSQDVSRKNDTIRSSFMVTDSVYAREIGERTGTFGIGPGSDGMLGQAFEIRNLQELTSVSIYLVSPNIGDDVKVEVWSYDPDFGPEDKVLESLPFKIEEDVEKWYTLPIEGTDRALEGHYIIAVREEGENITLGTCREDHTPGAIWYYLNDDDTWYKVEDAQFYFAYMIRANLQDYIGNVEEKTSNLKLMPNPAQNIVAVSAENAISKLSVKDITGRVFYTHNPFAKDFYLDVTTFVNGIYFVEISTEKHTETKKLIIKK